MKYALILQAKAAIRNILPIGLKETISKVRSSVAYAVSAIAHWDWPEQWPQLFDILMEALTSGSQEAVHGAMRVLTGKILQRPAGCQVKLCKIQDFIKLFTEFCSEVTDNQMPQVAPVILPEMYKIFTQDQVGKARSGLDLHCYTYLNKPFKIVHRYTVFEQEAGLWIYLIHVQA